jgi:hypothetical protein
MDKIPVPVQKKFTFKLFGIPLFSKTTVEVVSFDHDEYYEEMKEKISTEILENIKLQVSK